MTFTIDGEDAVNRLRVDRALRQTIRHIVIAIPGVPGSHPLERVINRTYFACGCRTGALAVYAAAAVACALKFGAPDVVAWTWWKFGVVVLSASLAGKLVGLGLSRVRLNGALRHLVEEMRGYGR